ncbi:sodium:solute symporter family transporter [Brevibacillus centrosporus]|uniref:sodium:solute symporter family transporter n=1 Tax=Brevibacillus centrosporus TaxID=54910 RepID=UPI0039887DB1
MNASIFVILGFLLISIYWAIGASKGQQKSIEQWALGGRGMGTIITFFLLAGEFFTTFSLTGLVGLGYNSGVSAMYFMTYITLGCVVGFWLLPAIRRYGSKHNLISQSDFYAKKYDSPLLGRLVTLVGVVSMIPLMIISLKGLGILVSVASYGSISPTMAIWIGTIAVVIYTMLSGLHGSSRVALNQGRADVRDSGVPRYLSSLPLSRRDRLHAARCQRGQTPASHFAGSWHECDLVYLYSCT